MRNENDAEDKISLAIQSKLFKIAIRLEEPFVMLKPIKEGEYLEGNDRFHGYCIELIQKIQHQLKFKYEFELVADGKNGNFDPAKNEWNGLIGEIMKDKADLAIADLTIVSVIKCFLIIKLCTIISFQTYDRKKVVDFTNPFMNLGKYNF